MFGGGLGVVELRLELAEHSVKKMVGFKASSLLNRSQRFKTGFRAVNLADSHGAVEGDDRGIVEFAELIVERLNLLPVGAFVIFRRAMARGDAGLEVIGGHFTAASGLRQMQHAARDHRLIPCRTILLFQAK